MPTYTWFAVQIDNDRGEINEHSVFHAFDSEEEAADALGGFPYPGFLCRENSRGQRRYDFGGGFHATPEEAVAACVAVNEMDTDMAPGATIEPEDGPDLSGALAALNAPEDGDEQAVTALAEVARILGLNPDDSEVVFTPTILAIVRNLVAPPKRGSTVTSKLNELSVTAKSLLDDIAEATEAKIDGRRDWETLGYAIHAFDKEMGGAIAARSWDCPADIWNALTGYQRFLCLTGHNKTGWSKGGPRTIYGVKCPSHSGTGYDKQRERLKVALEAMGFECGEHLRRPDGLVAMLQVGNDTAST